MILAWGDRTAYAPVRLKIDDGGVTAIADAVYSNLNGAIGINSRPALKVGDFKSTIEGAKAIHRRLTVTLHRSTRPVDHGRTKHPLRWLDTCHRQLGARMVELGDSNPDLFMPWWPGMRKATGSSVDGVFGRAGAATSMKPGSPSVCTPWLEPKPRQSELPFSAWEDIRGWSLALF
jgi:hypothetical protein